MGSVGGGEAKLWVMEAQGKYHDILRAYLPNFIPGIPKPYPQEIPQQEFIARSIHFIENGQAIVVCYLETHEMQVIAAPRSYSD